MFRYFTRLIQNLGRKERIVFFCACGLFCGALIVTIWTTFITHTRLEPARGGEYTEGLVGQPTAINPMQIGSSSVDRDLAATLFADLITLSHDVATSTTGKVWIVTLKEDMVWSDGKAITADDVLFTVHTIQNPDAGSPLFGAWQGITVERASQLQVRFTLKAAYAYFEDNLRSLRIAPAHIFESIPVSNIRLSDYNLKPVASGPYKFDSFEKQANGFITDYHLFANNDYPGARALIENLNFKFYPTYIDAIMAFNRKAIDGLGGFDESNVENLKISHTTFELATPHYYAIFLNPTANPVLKDRYVRQALNLATDKKEIINSIFNGHATVVAGPIPSSLPGHDATVYSAEHSSFEEAIALLEKQQWKIGSDGVRARGSGKNAQQIALELTTPDIPFMVRTANLVKAQWQKIGAKISLKIVPPEDIRASTVDPRAYQALLFGNILRANTDLYSFWHSSQRFQPGLNLSLYQNSSVDKLIETTRKTFDEAQRLQALTKIQQQIYADQPAIFLYSPNYLYAGPNDLGGLTKKPLASPEDRLSKVNEWFLQTSRVFK